MLRIASALRPDEREIVELARAEMSPACYESFRPIAAGPVVAVCGLAAVFLGGVLAAPFRLLRILRR